MKPKSEEDPGTSATDIIESLKNLSVGKDAAVSPKTAILDAKSDVETMSGGETSSKGEEKAPVGKVASPSNVSDGLKHHTSAMDVPLHAEEAESPSQLMPSLASAHDGAIFVSTTAEFLIEAVSYLDTVPDNPLVRQQFGYSKVNSIEEETCLQGLYKGLFLLPCSPSSDELQEWVLQDKLAEGVENRYMRCGARSGYFNWFKRNKHVLSQRYERVEGPWSPTGTWLEVNSMKLHQLTKSDTEEDEDHDDDDDDDD